MNEREINIINNILLELNENKEDKERQESLIIALESILTRKENICTKKCCLRQVTT